MKKYLLIGGSIACYGAIEGIKSVDDKAAITVLCGEKTPLYSRPLISYLLEGKTTEENVFFRGKDYYEQKKVKVVYKKAQKIDPKKRTVTMEDGENFSYDELFLGTGSVPFVPPIKGLEKVENKTCFYTLEDEKKLSSLLSAETRLLIIGAGLIGIKCAEGAYKHTKNVTIVDLQERVLPNATTPEVGRILQKHMEEKGIRFILGASASEFSESSVLLSNGEKVDFDVVVLAIGVRPNVGFIKEAGAEVNRGVIVDEYMKTSLPHVFCAGDCAEGYDAVSGQKRLLQLFPSAFNGGRIAGRNMAGDSCKFITDCALNSTSLFGLQVTSCGLTNGTPEVTGTEKGYKAFYVDGDYLVGYVLVGDTKGAGVYTNLISNRVPLSSLKEKPFVVPSLEIFDKETRKKFLAKKV